jgi:nicotinate phosphoribosyltransferase
MQQAVLQQFPEVQATYRFTNRDNKVLFSRKCVERFRAAVSCEFLRSVLLSLTSFLHSGFALLSLTDFELQWLKESCPYFTPDYLSYLSSYRFKPEQVSIHFVPSSSDGQQGNVEILVSGLWVEVILWEVPLMACLSESYFQTVITDWSYDGQEGMLRAPYDVFFL